MLSRLPARSLLLGVIAGAGLAVGCADDDFGSERPAQDAAAPGQTTDLVAAPDLTPAPDLLDAGAAPDLSDGAAAGG